MTPMFAGFPNKILYIILIYQQMRVYYTGWRNWKINFRQHDISDCIWS